MAKGPVLLLEIGARIADCTITCNEEDEHLSGNTAVTCQSQGQQCGDPIIQFAEAPQSGRSRLFLYTNVEITEILEYHTMLGYKKYNPAQVLGFERAFSKKGWDHECKRRTIPHSLAGR